MKIIPNGIYNGAYISGTPSVKEIDTYEKSTNEHLDIAIIYHEFKNGFEFPSAAARKLSSRKITPFIKLEPWSKAGKENYDFDLEKIIKGEFDEGIKRFAQQAKFFGKPFFISFCPGINDNCSCGNNSEKFKKAYKHIVNLFRREGVANVTWVWEISVKPSNYSEYYPGDDYVDWIGLNGFSTDETKVKTSGWQLYELGEGKKEFKIVQEDKTGHLTIPATPWHLFDDAVKQLKSFKKPIIISETGCDEANGSNTFTKELFIETLPSFCKSLGVSGLIYFNKNRITNGKNRIFALTKDNFTTLNRAINLLDQDFNTIVTLSPEPSPIPTPKPTPRIIVTPSPKPRVIVTPKPLLIRRPAPKAAITPRPIEKPDLSLAIPNVKFLLPLDRDIIRREVFFKAASGTLAGRKISLKSMDFNDNLINLKNAGLAVNLSRPISGRLVLIYKGKVIGGSRRGAFSVIFYKTPKDLDYNKDISLGKEIILVPSDSAKKVSLTVPKGTNKIVFMLIGRGKFDVELDGHIEK